MRGGENEGEITATTLARTDTTKPAYCGRGKLSPFSSAFSDMTADDSGHARRRCVPEYVQNQKPAVQKGVSSPVFDPGDPPRSKRRRHRLTLTRLLALTTAVYLFVPYWFYMCSWWRRQVIFLNNINMDWFVDIKSPSSLGLRCARNFYVQSDPGVRLGAWHVPPQSQLVNGTCPGPGISSVGSRPVVLYFHGTGFTRATHYRRVFYRVVTESALDAHLVTFDYRGFGDSSDVYPSMEGVVRDAEVMYRWLLTQVPKDKVVLWGHSLGSGIAVQLASKLAGSPTLEPPVIILESTFTSMYDAVYSFPFSALHNFLPFFDGYVAKTIGYHPDTSISNDDKIERVRSAILILHAEDDRFLSVHKARLLHRLALGGKPGAEPLRIGSEPVRTKPTCGLGWEKTGLGSECQSGWRAQPDRIRYVEFGSDLGYGHMNLNKDPRIPEIVNDFLRDIRSLNRTVLGT